MTTARVRISFAPQPGPQTAYIESPFDITVYGGARGGGKTFGSLGDFFIHALDYGESARGLMIRKTREDLKDTIAIATTMFGLAAKWTDKGAFFNFFNGARLYCAYLENDADAEHYQGWSLTRLYVEELTQFASPTPVMKMLATLRSGAGIRCQMKCTCNPGGPGHLWVKQWAIDNGAYVPFTDPDTKLTRVFIPALVTDNPALLQADPRYIDRLRAVGSEQLVRAWLEGDWNVIEGAFFPEFTRARHVIPVMRVPRWWTRFRAADWGSAKPFSIGWYAVVQDDYDLDDGRVLPRGALVRYREYYGCKTGEANVGLKMPAEQVARQIVSRETLNNVREEIAYGVMDPSAFNVVSGPSIGEVMQREGVIFKRADNTRVATDKKMSGWNQVRQRLVGDVDGRAMLFLFETNMHLIRTLPVMQHDDHNPEDLDTDGEDHAVDELRYACMSRPYTANVVKSEDLNPFLVKNAFKLEA
jgi:terminase large subunit-like protein